MPIPLRPHRPATSYRIIGLYTFRGHTYVGMDVRPTDAALPRYDLADRASLLQHLNRQVWHQASLFARQ